jgi:hypothetical protein
LIAHPFRLEIGFGRRRSFPWYEFASEADLLDATRAVLPSGSKPRKIMAHVPKIYLSTKEFDLEQEEGEDRSRRRASATSRLTASHGSCTATNPAQIHLLISAKAPCLRARSRSELRGDIR